jgi:hypothetical protein
MKAESQHEAMSDDAGIERRGEIVGHVVELVAHANETAAGEVALNSAAELEHVVEGAAACVRHAPSEPDPADRGTAVGLPNGEPPTPTAGECEVGLNTLTTERGVGSNGPTAIRETTTCSDESGIFERMPNGTNTGAYTNAHRARCVMSRRSSMLIKV